MHRPKHGGVSMEYSYADFDAQPDPSHRPMYLSKVLNALRELPHGAKVLDAGCGGGDFATGLAEAGYRIFGSDMSASAISAAQARKIGNFQLGSIYEPLGKPFGVANFDAIVCVEVIEHLYSPKAFAATVYDALPDGGLIVISTPYWGYIKNIVLAVTNRIDRSLTALWEGGHIKHFSRATLSTLMTSAGFEIVSFEGCGEGWRANVPGLWSGMLMTFRKPVVRHWAKVMPASGGLTAG